MVRAAIVGLTVAVSLSCAIAQQPVAAQTQPPPPVQQTGSATPALPSADADSALPSSPSAEKPVSTLDTQPTSTVVISPESPKELAEAKREFDSGVKLKNSGKLEDAFKKFQHAAQLNPHSVDYVTAREIVRAQLAMDSINRGNQALEGNKEIVAMAEFRKALEFDPQNEFATQRLRESVWRAAPESNNLRMVDSSEAVVLEPNPSHHDFHFRGDAQSLLAEVGKAYGISVLADDSVKHTQTRFDIEDVNFATAMEAVTSVTKTFWVALSPKQVLVLPESAANRAAYERMTMRTFYLPDLLTQQEVAEMVNLLRVVLDIRYIQPDQSQTSIIVRAPQPILDAATQVLENIVQGRPEVLLDVRVYQISQSLLRNLGMALPTQFTLFNINQSALAALGAGAQNLINQLIASGGINQANSTAIQALLSQLAQSSSGSQLLGYQPFVTFGGGITFMGLTAQPKNVTANFNINQSWIKNLENAQLRASQNQAATLLVGERYPIINATYAPIYNSQSIANVIGNGSYIAPVPSINYEDLGLKLKVTPVIHSDTAVTMKMELQIRSLGASSVNGIPIINNREYSGSIMVKNGESSVVAGIISEMDSKTINGYPFLSRVPGLTYASSLHTKNFNEDDLLVVVTPHIVRMPVQESVAVSLPSGH